MNYFAKIRYLGNNFHGFQVQPGLRTVQGVLNATLNEFFGYEVQVTGCSRTDSGVHANEFVVRIDAEGATVPPTKLPLALAEFLPPDLSLYYAEEAKPGFHPRYDVKSKEYLYRIINQKIFNPFEYGRAWFLPRAISEGQLEIMKDAAMQIVGTWDFTSFMSSESDVEDTVRTVYYLDITKENDEIKIKISADGFLYNMVRIIVGTLVDTAFGKYSVSDIRQIIEAKDRKKAGRTAPPEGLYLNKVIY